MSTRPLHTATRPTLPLSGGLLTRVPSTWARLAIAWTPMWAIYSLFVHAFGDFTVLQSIARGFVSVALAAVLGTVVWRFVDRHPWPERQNLAFLTLHVASGLVYATAWAALLLPVDPFLTPDTSFVTPSFVDLMGMTLIGLWIYGMVAGVCYAIHSNRELQIVQDRAARAEALAAKSQLAALRAQLNPHFLFNALHSLSTLVRRDSDAAERAIERMGSLLRYALEDTERQNVRLADEWRFVCNYLDLEQLRFDTKLRVQDDLSPEALNCVVPSFTLQTLVENAVRHGMTHKIGDCILQVRAEVDGDSLLIRVLDDGVGEDPERVAASKGTGLRGLRQRLDAEYGSAASVRIETAPGSGFSATVRLPSDGVGDPGDE